MHTPSQTYNDICWLCHCWFKNHRPIAGQGCKALEIILAHLVTLYKSSKLYLRRYITYYKVYVLLEEYLYLKFAQLKNGLLRGTSNTISNSLSDYVLKDGTFSI